MMKRRKILKYTALATGAIVSAPLANVLLTSCQSNAAEKAASKQKDYQLTFFNNEEFSLIEKLIDYILPRTDSPSASELGIHRVIDTMVGTIYRQEEKANFKKEFSSFSSYLSNKNFLALSDKEQIQLLQQLDLSEEENIKDVKKGFTNIKQQTIAYYLSSKEIATNYLNYSPVPGKYEPCIKLEDVGNKIWAL